MIYAALRREVPQNERSTAGARRKTNNAHLISNAEGRKLVLPEIESCDVYAAKYPA